MLRQSRQSRDEEAGGFELTRLLLEAEEEEKPEDEPVWSRTDTAFLDGLRGLAALFVFIQHHMPFHTAGKHAYGFGQAGKYYYFVGLPFLRLFTGSGGDAAVVIFFILSGYVLSIGPLRDLRYQKNIRLPLLGSFIRRPFRLYIPPLVISFLYACLMHVPGQLVLPVEWLHKPKESLWGELQYWCEESWNYFSIFREHGSDLTDFPYNYTFWTLPIELQGSILVYGRLFLLSFGMRGGAADGEIALAVTVFVFILGAVMIQLFWKWSMVCFNFGMFLALLDTWPMQRPTWMKPDSRTARICPRWVNVSLIWIQNFRLPLPDWLTKHYIMPLFHHACFFAGWYLLSQPARAGHREYSSTTPGWIWLDHMIPESYDENRYYRYWQTWGGLLLVYGVLRIRWAQRFLTTRPLQFLGYISFMLYIIHTSWFRIFPDRFHTLVGYAGAKHEDFWDGTFSIPDWGPVGLSTRVLVCYAVSLFSTAFLAWIATFVIDQPSVWIGKWITGVLGLDKARPKPVAEVAT